MTHTRRPWRLLCLIVLAGCSSARSPSNSVDTCSPKTCPSADTVEPPDSVATTPDGADPGAPDCSPACLNGGSCVAHGSGAACDCPVGTSGPICEHVCKSEPLVVAACSSIAAPDAFFTVASSGGAPACLVKVPFVVDAPADVAGPVTATVTVGDTTVSRFELVNTQGNRWEGEGLATAGAEYTARIASTAGQLSVTTATAPACPSTTPAIACDHLFRPGLDISYECSGDAPGCTTTGSGCEGGCVKDLWMAFVSERPRMLTELRLRFDWWSKRPAEFEIWAAARLSDTPEKGAELIYAGTAALQGHQCVTGQPCGDDVPDDCCPDGRDAPQRVEEGAFLSKYDFAVPSFARSQIFYLRVRDTQYPKALIFQSIEALFAVCESPGGIWSEESCRTWSAGPAAGCGKDEWCAPFDPATGALVPTCAPAGPGKVLEPCDSATACVAGALCSGGRCVELCDRASGLEGCDGLFEQCAPSYDWPEWTYAFGSCSPGDCAVSFDSSDCPIGTWCKPAGPDTSNCELAGPGLTGQTCSVDTDCAAGLGCLFGHCARLCSPGSDGPGGKICTGGEVCAGFEGLPGIGYCTPGCDPVTGPSCPTGLTCMAAEMLGASVPFCATPPTAWPDADGFDFLAACPTWMSSSICGPMSLCLNVADVAELVCIGVCRFSKGPAGGGHPDCTPGFECLDVISKPEFGVCVPPQP